MKGMLSSIGVAAGCVAVLVMAGCGGQQPLQVHFAEGFERVYETRERVEFEMSIPVINEGMRQNQRSTSRVRIAVEDPGGDGPATMRIAIEDASVDMRFSFMGESFSMEGDDNPMADFIEALVGEEYRVMVQPDGNIVEFRGYEELFDKVLEAQGIGALTRSELGAYMKEMWNADQERLSMQKSVFAGLPMTRVSPGDTWSMTYTVSNPIPMQVEDTYRVLNVHDDRVTLDVTSVISAHPTESSIDFGAGFSMQLEARGDGEGFIEVDRASGWINEASTTLRIRGEAEMRGMPMPIPGGMDKIPLVSRVEIESKAM